MRLQREAKMAVRELESQIKKSGKINNQNYICLPDPANVYEWYYIVFGLDAPYKGGYYIGKIKCKETYPATAPNITLYTDNGKFRTHKLQPDGICLSISDFHQESWNPAWKVTQIVMGLVSFWLDNEYTYGSVESYDYQKEPLRNNDAEFKARFAMLSREDVIAHEKFEEIFKPYAAAIGIDVEQSHPEWDAIKEKIAKIEEDKAKAEAEKKLKEQKEAEEKAIAEEIARKADLINNRDKIISGYFKKIKDQNLTRLVGLRPEIQKMALLKA